MKAYHKRLLTVAVSMALLLWLSSVFVADVFRADARQLQITPTGSVQSADGLNRSSGVVPTDAEIEQDGYDTALTEGFALVLEDERSALYFQEKTAEVALMDKATGHIWYSNPQSRAGETLVDGTTKLRLGAQVTVTYYDQKGAFGMMDSYNDSIAYDGMSYSVTTDKLLVTYRLGKVTVTLADVPQQISKSRMEQFIAVLPESDQADLLKNYRLASITGHEDDTDYVNNLVKKYPNVVNEDVYYLTKDSSRILKKVKGYMDQCGYTYDDLDYDNAENGVVTEASSRVHFGVTLSYRLEEGALLVSLKGNALTYDEKIPPYEIRLLEYFGAGDATEQGYMLVPDGSGSLIYYNNGKTNEPIFSTRIYGADTVSDTESAYVADKKASLPVFGVKNGSAALLVSIDQGAELCSINARVAGMSDSYNTVYTSVLATSVDFMSISDSRQIYFESAPYRGDVVLRYAPLEEAENDYMGMARAYRQRLLAQGTLGAVSGEKYALAADVICAAPMTEVVAGLPVEGTEALTTYAEASQIGEALSGSGGAVWLRLEGWQQGGMRQGAQTRIRAERVLGGSDGLRALAQQADDNGWLLLPETWLETDRDANTLISRNAFIRDLCRDVAVRYEYDYTNRYQRYNGRTIYQLTAARFMRQAAQYASDAAKAGLSAVAVPDIGNDLWSDFTASAPVNRVAMARAQEEALSSLNALTVALSNPNAYALGYADAIYDMPCADSGFRLTDESVPFYPAVVRGSVPYVCEPINYAEDVRMAFLQAVEFGAGLQYTLTWETTALLKDTDYAWINRGRFSDWEETIREQYARAYEVLAPLAGVEMSAHERVAFNVYKTTYANGAEIVVNYGSEAVVVDGVTVSAKDFALGKAGEGK